VFLINRLPTSVLGYKSPHEVVFGSALTYDSLRVFGCSCYPLLAPFGRSKLDFKSTRCVFLGYSTNHKGYLCLEPQTHHFYISRHVKFNELQFPYKCMYQPDTHASQLFKIKALPQLLKTVAEKSIATSPQDSHHDPATIVQNAENVQEESAPQPATFFIHHSRHHSCTTSDLSYICSSFTATASYDYTNSNREAKTQGFYFFTTSHPCLFCC